jgi:hypothetical protein
MYAVFQRSAFCRMNAFHAEPQAGARPKVFIAAAETGRRSEYTHRLPPPTKSSAA